MEPLYPEKYCIHIAMQSAYYVQVLHALICSDGCLSI